jgi:hypothetical protein
LQLKINATIELIFWIYMRFKLHNSHWTINQVLLSQLERLVLPAENAGEKDLRI